jgi:hypothetical protein
MPISSNMQYIYIYIYMQLLPLELGILQQEYTYSLS